MERRGASRGVARNAAGGWRGRVGRCWVNWRAGLAEWRCGGLIGGRTWLGGRQHSRRFPPNGVILWQKYLFSSAARPLTPIHLAGGGGRCDVKIVNYRALLALRQLPPLA